MLRSAEEYRIMAAVESRHWWYLSLHEQVVETIRALCAAEDPAILDAGCGTGGLLGYLGRHGYTNLSGFDISEEAVRHCREQELQVWRDELVSFAQRLNGRELDVVVSNDTLVYLDSRARRAFLAQCERSLRAGGLLICNVAALEAFRGIHDIAVGSTYRLDRPAIRELFDRAPWRLRRLRYWPFVLSPVIYAVRLRQRQALRRNPDSEPRSDLYLSTGRLNGVLHALTTLERRLRIPAPWGSSLFVAATLGEAPKQGAPA